MTATPVPLQTLIRHPASVASSVQALSVEVTRDRAGQLSLTFRAEGDLAGLYLPQAAPPLRTDELWKRTCFEAFVKAAGSEAYLELNLAPSGCWAAYSFSACRTGMADLALPAPQIAATPQAETFVLVAKIDLSGIADLANQALSLNLTTVIEDLDGAHAWWALAHPSPNPDFHHPEAFVLSLPAPERA